MTRKRKAFPTATAARIDMRCCTRCQHPFSLALDGPACPECGCVESVPQYQDTLEPSEAAP